MNKVYIAIYDFNQGRNHIAKQIPEDAINNDQIRRFISDSLQINTAYDVLSYFIVHHKDQSDLDYWANRCSIERLSSAYKQVYKMNQIYKFIDFIEKDDDKFAGLLRLRMSQY